MSLDPNACPKCESRVVLVTSWRSTRDVLTLELVDGKMHAGVAADSNPESVMARWLSCEDCDWTGPEPDRIEVVG